MKTAIMQPYLFPYLGYFQLIKSVDQFVLLDDVNYIKGGWVNRNRILLQGEPHTFTLPLKESSQNKKICDLELINPYGIWMNHFRKKFFHCYSKAPYFRVVDSVLEQMAFWKDINLVDIIEKTLRAICNELRIELQIFRSTDLTYVRPLRGQERIIEICRQLETTEYINMIGGKALYETKGFAQEGISLRFLQMNPITYRQFSETFIPHLSILDLMAFNDKLTLDRFLADHTLIDNYGAMS